MMENWQKQYIKDNLLNLIENTKVNVPLIASLVKNGILGKADEEALENQYLLPLGKSRKLYDIIATRENGYISVLEALKQTNQTGALKILRNCLCFRTETDSKDGKRTPGLLKGSFEGIEIAVKKFNVNIYDKESEMLRLLPEHENIIRYYGEKTGDGFLYMALEYCDKNLENWMKNGIDRKDFVEIMRQSSSGVKFLHDSNIIHGNLRPKSIRLKFVGTEMNVKISGFSKAAVIDVNANSQDSIRSNDHQNELTKAGDVFALGCVFAFVFAKGNLPYEVIQEDPHLVFQDKMKTFGMDSVLLDFFLPLLLNMTRQSPSKRCSIVEVSEAISAMVSGCGENGIKVVQEKFLNPDTLERKRLVDVKQGSGFENSSLNISGSESCTGIPSQTNLRLRTGNDLVPRHLPKIFNKKPVIDNQIASNVIKYTELDKNLLFLVSKNRSLSEIKNLVEQGANINVLDPNGTGCMHYASQYGNIATLEYLISKGCLVDIRNCKGNNPAFYAVGNLDVLKCLQEAGAKLGVQNNAEQGLLQVGRSRLGDTECKKFEQYLHQKKV